MRGLLYTCSVRFGSSIVAVLGSFQVLWGTPVELHWGTCSSKVEVGPPLEFWGGGGSSLVAVCRVASV